MWKWQRYKDTLISFRKDFGNFRERFDLKWNMNAGWCKGAGSQSPQIWGRSLLWHWFHTHNVVLNYRDDQNCYHMPHFFFTKKLSGCDVLLVNLSNMNIRWCLGFLMVLTVDGDLTAQVIPKSFSFVFNLKTLWSYFWVFASWWLTTCQVSALHPGNNKALLKSWLTSPQKALSE